MFRRKILEQAAKLLRIVRPEPAHVSSAASPDNPGQLPIDMPLAPHAALVRRIRVAYGYPDDQFEQHLLAPITELAAWLHVLPGHPAGGFEHRGGAIEQALTNCLFCLQAADGRTFDGLDTGPSYLQATQRWRLACALGGLFASLPEVLTRIEVVSDDGRLWPASAIPLLHWLESLPATKYHYRWTAARSELRWPAIYAASRCIAPDVMSFLVGGDGRVAAALLESIAGSDPSTQVSDLVNKIAAAVAARDASSATSRPAETVVNALKRLLSTSDWLPNSPGGHVWFGTDGLYLLWPDAATKLAASIPRGIRGTAGVAPHDDLLGDLVAGGIVDASPSPLFHIRPPGHATAQAAVRVAEPCRALRALGQRVAPLELRLCVPVFPEPAAGEDAAEATGIVDVASNGAGSTACDADGHRGRATTGR